MLLRETPKNFWKVKRLVQNGDETVAIAGMLAAEAVSDIMDNWGSMEDWRLEASARYLRELLEVIER